MNEYRELSFWFDSLNPSLDDLSPRPPLAGDLAVDVAIVGGGLTGLWTAYYLATAQPSLRIAVLEKHIAGFGASGRNGGWCSALFPSSTASLARRHGRDAAVAMRRAMIETVDEVGRVATAEGIDCDFVRGGTVTLARSRTQLDSANAEVAEAAHCGWSFGMRSTLLEARRVRSAPPSTPPVPACIRRNSCAGSLVRWSDSG